MGTEAADAALREQLLALYSAACAPLSTSSLLTDLPDLEPRDLTARVSVDEFRYVTRLAAAGFDAVAKAFDTFDIDAIETVEDKGEPGTSPEITVALTAAGAFAKRISVLTDNLNTLTSAAAEKSFCDPTTLVRSLEDRVKQGDRPPDPELATCLDFTPNTRWGSLELPLRNRVGFKTTTAVISEGKVEEEALKVAEFRRKKQRNPTGYQKFHFKDLGLEESDFESEGHRSRAGSVPGISTDGGSTRGSVSLGAGGPLTSRSVSSGAEEHEDLEEVEGGGRPPLLEQRGSSVVFSFDKEREVIEDEVADPEWDEKQRHQRRFSRIRNRVPTGHPCLMRGATDELAGIVNQFERQLSSVALDEATTENTELNKTVPLIPEDEAVSSPPTTTTGKKGVTISE